MTQSNKDIIIKSLGVPEFEYREFKRDAAWIWLDKFFGDPESEDAISLIPLFWKWWNNQWDIRDEEFIRLTNLHQINEVLTGQVRVNALSLYNEIHNVHDFIVQPNRFLNIEIRKVLQELAAKEEMKIKKLK